jgi:hypothetical protein
MPPQAAGYTCSACSLAWVLRAKLSKGSDATYARMQEQVSDRSDNPTTHYHLPMWIC